MRAAVARNVGRRRGGRGASCRRGAVPETGGTEESVSGRRADGRVQMASAEQPSHVGRGRRSSRLERYSSVCLAPGIMLFTSAAVRRFLEPTLLMQALLSRCDGFSFARPPTPDTMCSPLLWAGRVSDD